MAKVLFTACLSLLFFAPARAGQPAGAAKALEELPFDINAGVNADGKLAIGFNVSVSLLNRLAKDACVGGGMKLVDPSAPVVTSEGGDLIISNIENGMGRPYFVLTPFSSGKNTIGFAVKTMTVSNSALWTFAQLLGLTEEKAFDKVLKLMEAEFAKGLPAALASEVPTPQQLVWFSHDAVGKTVYMSLANAFALPAMPRMEFDSIALKDGVFTLSMSTSESAHDVAAKGYVLALDGKALGTVLAKVLNQRDSEGKTMHSVHSAGPGEPGKNMLRVTGYKVLEDVRVPISGKPLEVAYDAAVYVYMPEPNFLCIEARKVDITWWGTDMDAFLVSPPPGLSFGFAQRALIEKVIDNIAQSGAMNEMAEVSKLNSSTAGIRFKKGAVLPALSRYVDITGVRLEDGKAYLSYGLAPEK